MVRSVDFSGRGAVATGRKPVVGGRAVHSSDSSLVGYRPCSLRRGERTNERLRRATAPSFIPPYTRERVHARISSRGPLRLVVSPSYLDWLPASCSMHSALRVPTATPKEQRVPADCFPSIFRLRIPRAGWTDSRVLFPV